MRSAHQEGDRLLFADRQKVACPLFLPARRDPLFLLAGHQLEVEGERFPISPPRAGDVTQAKRLGGRLSFGLAAADVPRLLDRQGEVGHLLTRDGHPLRRLRIDRVDPRLAVLLATPLP